MKAWSIQQVKYPFDQLDEDDQSYGTPTFYVDEGHLKYILSYLDFYLNRTDVLSVSCSASRSCIVNQIVITILILIS